MTAESDGSNDHQVCSMLASRYRTGAPRRLFANPPRQPWAAGEVDEAPETTALRSEVDPLEANAQVAVSSAERQRDLLQSSGRAGWLQIAFTLCRRKSGSAASLPAAAKGSSAVVAA